MRKANRAAASFLLMVFLTAAAAVCAGAANSENDSAPAAAKAQARLPALSLEEYPRVDGSLACVPLMEELAMKVTGCSRPEAEQVVGDWFTNTNPCYQQLAMGERDLLLAYEPSQVTVQSLKDDPDQYPHEPVMEPVGKDALVFMVNKNNPVENLTQRQLRGIFTGEITNWREVGGPDREIRVFTRPENSGSQTLMRKLLVGDAGMAKAQTEEVSSMEGIIRALLEYTNEANAIGYSVYYYASMMYDQPDLKFLRVDDIAPGNDSIRTGEYPLVNPFYCVTSDVSSEPAAEMKDWLLSPEGQDFVKECGYVPAK